MTINNETILDLLKSRKHEEIIMLCEPIVYHYMHKTGFWNKFKNEREDMLQEGRLAIYKCIETFDGRSKFTTYVHNAVRNSLYNYVRKLSSTDNELDIEVESDAPSMETLTIYKEMINEIKNHHHKNILSLFFIDEMTQQEVGEALNVSQQWVANVVNSFKKEMRDKYV